MLLGSDCQDLKNKLKGFLTMLLTQNLRSGHLVFGKKYDFKKFSYVSPYEKS
jgi:hypothetical protein